MSHDDVQSVIGVMPELRGWMKPCAMPGCTVLTQARYCPGCEEILQDRKERKK